MRPCNPTAVNPSLNAHKPRLRTGLSALLLLTICASPALATVDTASPTATVTTPSSSLADKLFSQGQKAYHHGDLALAIDLYTRADRAGFADPILAYNLGVAHYQIGDYEPARSAFLTAAATPKLAPLAFYNLGLVDRKTGADRDAYVWFDQARRHPHASAKMQRLARKAMTSIEPASIRSQVPVAFTRPAQDRFMDHLRISVNTGFATDSNIYRSPSESYVDLAQPGAPTVDPEVQSGTYIPLQTSAALLWGTHEGSNFELRYALDGRFYSDAQFSNANVMEHEFSIGGEMRKPTKRGNVYWRSHFLVTKSDEQAYDRDDGQAELVNDEDVSDRYSSTRFGPAAYYHRDIGRFGYGFRFNAFIDRFEETVDFLDLTHEQYLGGAHVSFRPLRNTLVRLSGDYYERSYSDRVASAINGNRFTDNDELEYTYKNLGLTVRQKLLRSFVVGLDYRYTLRDDTFEGYDDYERHTGRGYLRFRHGRFSARASYTYQTYNFPNALNFDDTPADPWPLQATYGELEAEYRFGKRYTVRAEAIFDLVSSTDPRGDYDRNRLALSLIWRP